VWLEHNVFCFANHREHGLLCWEKDGRNPLNLYLFVSERRNAWNKILKRTTPLQITSHISDDNGCTPQNAPARDQDQPLSRWWHFSRLSTNGNSIFFKRCPQPHYFSRSPSHPVKFSFCAGVQFSRDIIRVFSDWIKISLVWLWTRVFYRKMPLVKFIRKYIRDSSGVFSISSLVRISMIPLL